jgi:hypothetical protein
MIGGRFHRLINAFLKAGEALVKLEQLRNRCIFLGQLSRPRDMQVPGRL